VTRESEGGLGLSLYGKSETFKEEKETPKPKEPTKVHRPPPVPMRVIV